MFNPPWDESKEEFCKYDAEGMTVYFLWSTGEKRIEIYNFDERTIYEKNYNGREYWGYDFLGKESFYKNSNGSENWYEYIYSQDGKLLFKRCYVSE